ncbi:MAG TPA: sulfatase-like hydrolase/transferase [bacterium]
MALAFLLFAGCSLPAKEIRPDLSTDSGGSDPIFIWENVALSPVPLKVGNTVSRAIVPDTPDGFSWTGNTGHGSRLDFQIGVVNSPSDVNSGPSDFSDINYQITANGMEIFNETIPMLLSDDWLHYSVDLPDTGADETTLDFSTSIVNTIGLTPAWGRPTIVTPRENPRHVILLGLDTLAAGHVGWLGYERDTTPFLDTIADKSNVFLNAHSSSPWTLPSFATVLSGRPPSVTGANRRNRGLSLNEDMIAEVFHRNGFVTSGFVNIPHLQEAGFFQGNDQQWEVHDHRAYEALNQARSWHGDFADQDTFAFIHLFDAHIPYVPPEGFASLFRDPAYNGSHAENWILDADTVTQNHTDPSVWASMSDEDRIQCEALYDSEIRGMDSMVEEFFAWYESAGLMDNTLLIVFADHGEEFGEHGRWEHGHSVYEEQINVPLLIHSPGQELRHNIEGLVGTIDIYPTLLELFDFTSEQKQWGLSLISLMNGEADTSSRTIISESTLWGPELKSIITGSEEKYIYNLADGREELYNLMENPAESDSLVEKDPGELAVFRDDLEKYISETLSGWHIKFLAGDQPMHIDLHITSSGELSNPAVKEQIFQGTKNNLSINGDGELVMNYDLVPGDSIKLTFDSENDSYVTVNGTIDGAVASEDIYVGATGKTMPHLMQLLNPDEFDPDKQYDLTSSITDPILAFQLPDYNGQEDRGAWIWTVPEQLRADEGDLSPEQNQELESVGYIFR